MLIARGGTTGRDWGRLLDDVKIALISLAAAPATPADPTRDRRLQGPMNNDNNRNLILFTAIAVAVLLAYQMLFLAPAEKRRAEARRSQAAAEATTTKAGPLAGLPTGVAPTNLTRDQAKAATPRLAIDTPNLKGSLSLVGGRIDDLFLKKFAETIEAGSPPVELLRPQGAVLLHFATFGWVGQNIAGLPDASTAWTTLDPAATLSPGHPVTLRHDNGAGVIFDRTIGVDDKYMFTISSCWVTQIGGR